MCMTTYQYYQKCTCTVVLVHICAAHIERTHKQADNATCPRAQTFDAKIPAGCERAHCKYKSDTFYTFETYGESLFEWADRLKAEWEEERARKRRDRVSKEIKMKGEDWYAESEDEGEKENMRAGGEEKVVKKVKREDGRMKLGNFKTLAELEYDSKGEERVDMDEENNDKDTFVKREGGDEEELSDYEDEAEIKLEGGDGDKQEAKIAVVEKPDIEDHSMEH